ncbi:uncharacterized protein P174DRAFT_147239 [Aspergillus novofumigatus IBT 16806]|uniref:Uncharacterized protein n=1 Tax=Aspergillus novofumigatus (strain IBT 16806) TaxID=1392255 RepID=A0A2I1CDZ6_ASPN1|nr:uncharacterized protein P174DRAFT_147239 [Aspergillus novofumigatus IBT 16806]PKX95852.1 hypothetical protein P174DRAFT_147239 [Aspergillus novofumigatus IBT 16806]
MVINSSDRCIYARAVSVHMPHGTWLQSIHSHMMNNFIYDRAVYISFLGYYSMNCRYAMLSIAAAPSNIFVPYLFLMGWCTLALRSSSGYQVIFPFPYLPTRFPKRCTIFIS